MGEGWRATTYRVEEINGCWPEGKWCTGSVGKGSLRVVCIVQGGSESPPSDPWIDGPFRPRETNPNTLLRGQYA
jgi:hypothetical protein